MTYPFNTLYNIVEKQAKKRKDKVALFVGEDKITYAMLKENTDKLATFLSKNNVKEGDKVALFLANSPEFLYALFAVSKIGAILVPVNTFLKSKELDYILEDSNSMALIASIEYEKVIASSKADTLCSVILWEGKKETETDKVHFSDIEEDAIVVPKVDRKIDDTAVIFYTSGTTGEPKGAILSNKNIIANAYSGRKTVEATEEDRTIVFLPMFHSFTFSIGLLLLLCVGGSLVLIRSITPFAPIFKETLKKRVTLFFGVPDIYNAMAKTKLPWYFLWLNNIRVFVSGAAPLQAQTVDAMNKKFKRASLLEGYGLSEASPAVAMNTIAKQKIGSVGTALYGYTVNIVDSHMQSCPRGEIGDIVVKGDNVMQGYLNRPEETAETLVDGWLLTGDIGYMDEDGFLFIVDRKKDLIISKGINIYPSEVEKIMNRYEGVAMSAVIGVDDGKAGEMVVAFIELDKDTKNFDIVELKKYMKEYLANFKIPKQIKIVDALPKNATGKLLKRILKEEYK